jgi:phosphoglycolate phosphatase
MSAAEPAGEPAELPPPERLRLVIFDCDGVLFDSYAANVAFYDAVLAAAGEEPLDAHGRHLCHTLASTQLFAQLFGDDAETLERVIAAARGVDYGPFYGLMEPAPALFDILEHIGRHATLALATNRGRTVEGVVERFGLARFFAIRVGVLDAAPKPAPDLLLACLERAAVAAEEAVYIGDALSDRAAAAAAGVGYVGVGEASGARVIVRSLGELPAVLLGRRAAAISEA